MTFFEVLWWIHITKKKAIPTECHSILLYMIFPLHSFSGSKQFALNITFNHFTVFHYFNSLFVSCIEMLHSSDNFIQFNFKYSIKLNWFDWNVQISMKNQCHSKCISMISQFQWIRLRCFDLSMDHLIIDFNWIDWTHATFGISDTLAFVGTYFKSRKLSQW